MNITERKKIHSKFTRQVFMNSSTDNPYGSYRTPEHILDGRSVAEWVAEARAGWPKVPVPSDPVSAARKVVAKYQRLLVHGESHPKYEQFEFEEEAPS
ncbi:hypothetical protein [Streptomyces griseus]|uniref:hypothetical protein n=1 Tax=Streptomyces griseus TaxID=1911 RepID=UPI0033C826B5